MTKTPGQSADRPAGKSPPPRIDPPRRRPGLLITSIALVVAWTLFLAVMAFGR